MKAYLGVLIVLGLQMSPLPAADKKEAPEPLPPKIVQAWRDAGANVGWMNMNLYLNRPCFEVEPWRQFRAEGQGFGSVREAWIPPNGMTAQALCRCFSSPSGKKACW